MYACTWFLVQTLLFATISYDCIPVGGAAAGTCAPPANVAQVVAVIQSFARCYHVQGGSITWLHIKAHNGTFYNEVVDCAAKAGAEQLVATGLPLLIGRAWFQDPTIAERASVAYSSGSQRARQGLPCVDGDHIVCLDPVSCSRNEFIDMLKFGVSGKQPDHVCSQAIGTNGQVQAVHGAHTAWSECSFHCGCFP